MERLTCERVNGIKEGYWSAEKKETLIARLAEYENTGKRGCRTKVRQLRVFIQHKTPSFEKPGVCGIISLCY